MALGVNKMNVLFELNNLQIDVNKKSKYHNYSINQLWNLYNAVMAGAHDGDEYEILAELKNRGAV